MVSGIRRPISAIIPSPFRISKNSSLHTLYSVFRHQSCADHVTSTLMHFGFFAANDCNTCLRCPTIHLWLVNSNKLRLSLCEYNVFCTSPPIKLLGDILHQPPVSLIPFMLFSIHLSPLLACFLSQSALFSSVRFIGRIRPFLGEHSCY